MKHGFRKLRFVINGSGLHFDRDYGCENRTGWCVLYGDGFVAQFVSFPRAIFKLLSYYSSAKIRVIRGGSLYE